MAPTSKRKSTRVEALANRAHHQLTLSQAIRTEEAIVPAPDLVQAPEPETLANGGTDHDADHDLLDSGVVMSVADGRTEAPVSHLTYYSRRNLMVTVQQSSSILPPHRYDGVASAIHGRSGIVQSTNAWRHRHADYVDNPERRTLQESSDPADQRRNEIEWPLSAA